MYTKQVVLNNQVGLHARPATFFIQKAKDYPDYANSDAYLIGKARYKDHDEEKAAAYEKQYGREGKEISFDLMNCLINYEVQEIIEQMERILR